MLADPIAGLRSPTGALVSVYLNRPSPGGFPALVTDTLRPLRARANHLPRSVQKSLRRDAHKIRDLADRLELEPAPSFAVFASDADDIFVVESLTHAIENRATLGPRPYLRPLRVAPRPLRAAVLVADRTEARIFVSSGDHLEEVGTPLEADIGKPNYGGFSGYQEHSTRSHAEEATSRIWREAGARLLDVHQDRTFDFLVIGSLDELADEIVGQLHPYLADLDRMQLHAQPREMTIAGLRPKLADLTDEVRARRQSALVGQVLDTAHAGGQAVLGLESAIGAANVMAVDTLVVAGWFTKPGVVCANCGALGRAGRTCVVCGQSTLPVDDVVSELMDAVVAGGGSVHQVTIPSKLDIHGVGAITRYPVQV